MSTKPRACHAKATGRAAETKGHRRDTGETPEGHRRDTGGTPEGHWRTPEGHRDVHPTPLQCTKSHACHAKATGRAAETKGHRRDTGGTPEGHRRDTGGTPEGHRRDTGGTPEGHRRDTRGTPEGHRGVHPTPLQCTKSHFCHAKATGRAAETKGHRRDTGGTPEGHRRDTGGTPEGHRRDTGAHIQPLCSAPSPTPATQMMFDDIMCGMCVCV